MVKHLMMIPTIGTRLTLLSPWTFRLYSESRNKILGKKVKADWALDDPAWYKSFEETKHCNSNAEIHTVPRNPSGRWTLRHHLVTLPVGTELVVDRIYIRRGKEEYDSITFRLLTWPGTKIKKGRFWVRLADANVLHCDYDVTTLSPVDGVPKQEKEKEWEQRPQGGFNC